MKKTLALFIVSIELCIIYLFFIVAPAKAEQKEYFNLENNYYSNQEFNYYVPPSFHLYDEYEVASVLILREDYLYSPKSKGSKKLLKLKINDSLLVLKPLEKKKSKWAMVLYKNQIAYVLKDAYIGKGDEVTYNKPFLEQTKIQFAYTQIDLCVFEKRDLTGKAIGRIPAGCNFIVREEKDKIFEIYFGEKIKYVSKENIKLISSDKLLQ